MSDSDLDKKGQAVRALDVWVVGPAIAAGGVLLLKQPAPSTRALGWFLLATGVATSIYNGNNWLKREAEIAARETE